MTGCVGRACAHGLQNLQPARARQHQVQQQQVVVALQRHPPALRRRWRPRAARSRRSAARRRCRGEWRHRLRPSRPVAVSSIGPGVTSILVRRVRFDQPHVAGCITGRHRAAAIERRVRIGRRQAQPGVAVGRQKQLGVDAVVELARRPAERCRRRTTRAPCRCSVYSLRTLSSAIDVCRLTTSARSEIRSPALVTATLPARTASGFSRANDVAAARRRARPWLLARARSSRQYSSVMALVNQSRDRPVRPICRPAPRLSDRRPSGGRCRRARAGVILAAIAPADPPAKAR